MARRRTIDPKFWTSLDIAALDPFARLVLIGLISCADDEGRGLGGAAYLRAVLFPFDDVPVTRMKRALQAIAERISIVFYTFGGREVYAFLNWRKWQRVDRPAKSRIPAPDQADDGDGDGGLTDGCTDGGFKDWAGRKCGSTDGTRACGGDVRTGYWADGAAYGAEVFGGAREVHSANDSVNDSANDVEGLSRNRSAVKEKERKRKEKYTKEKKKIEKEKAVEKGIITRSFDDFWAVYPRKQSKRDAEKAWRQLSPDDGLIERILQKVAEAKASDDWRRDGGRFIPYPATYLRKRRWEDETDVYDDRVLEGESL